MTVAKKRNQAVEDSKKHLLKMTVAKKIRPKRCKIQNGTFLKMTVAQKTEPNSARYTMCLDPEVKHLLRHFLRLEIGADLTSNGSIKD